MLQNSMEIAKMIYIIWYHNYSSQLRETLNLHLIFYHFVHLRLSTVKPCFIPHISISLFKFFLSKCSRRAARVLANEGSQRSKSEKWSSCDLWECSCFCTTICLLCHFTWWVMFWELWGKFFLFVHCIRVKLKNTGGF